MADKNLGPLLLRRYNYVKAIADQYFSNRKNLRYYVENKALKCLVEADNSFLKLMLQKGNCTGDDDLARTQISLTQDT